MHKTTPQHLVLSSPLLVCSISLEAQAGIEAVNMEQEDSCYTAKQKGKGTGREGLEENSSRQLHHVGETPPPIPKKHGRPKKELANSLLRSPTRPNADVKHEEDQNETGGGGVGKGPRQKSNSKRKDTIRWYIDQNNPTTGNHNVEANEGCPSELRPRQWCMSKAELLLIHPELSRKSCVNGISWEGAPLPIILLEGRHGMSISSVKSDGESPDQTTMDVTINRTFEYAIKDLPGGTLPDRIPLTYPIVALPQSESVAPNEGMSSCSRTLDTVEPVQAQNESWREPDRKAEVAADSVPIKHELSDIPLSMIGEPPPKQTRVKHQNSLRRSKRLKGPDSGDNISMTHAAVGNPQSMESGEQPNIAHEAPSAVEQGHIPAPRPAGSTLVSTGAKSQAAHPASSNPRPQLTIDIQCNSNGSPILRLSPLSTLTPSPVERQAPKPLRRSVRISVSKSAPTSIPDGKRKREVVPESNKSGKEKKQNMGKDYGELRIKQEEIATSIPVNSHPMTTRQTKGSSGPFKAKSIFYFPQSSTPRLPLPASKPKYAGMKFNKNKPPATIPVPGEKDGSSGAVEKSSIDSQTGTSQDIVTAFPASVLTIATDPQTLETNPNTVIEHPFPLQRSSSSDTPRSILLSSTQTKSDVPMAPASNHLIEAPLNEKVSSGHLPELPQTKRSQDVGSISLASAFPSTEITNNMDHTSSKHASYPSSENRLGPAISPAAVAFPSPIPSEIQALIDLQTNNTLILGIASREVFNDKAGTRLADEYGYVYTGFWRVIDVKTVNLTQEALSITRSGYVEGGPDYRVRGRVQWTFTLRWVPGQEEGQDPCSALYPWWRHFRYFVSPPEAINILSSFPNLVCPSLLISNVEDDGRRREDGWSAGDGDGGSSRGWYCSDCGKLNRQTYWRRRKCGSSPCRDKLVTACSAKTLDHVRDRGQQHPLVLPMNTHPRYIDPLIIDWENGMKTLVYETGPEHGISHVFTCNVEPLQEEQTILFERIQEEVILQRRPEDSRPYFSYAVAQAPSTFTLANGFSAPVETWDKAHPCIVQTRDLLSHTALHYGELKCSAQGLDIKSLLLLTWTVDGRRKGEIPLQAKEQGIVLMSLGHETLIRLFPKSGLGRVEVNPNTVVDLHAPPVSGRTHFPPAASNIVKSEPLEQAMDIDAPGLLSFSPQELEEFERKDFEFIPTGGTSSSGCSAPTTLRAKKADQRKDTVLKFTLVHGDALILFGDDFEYTIEREGISILLIGILG